MPGRRVAGWWGLAAALLPAVLAPVLAAYAARTHDELAWQLCYRVGTRPAGVWAAAIAAPVASLSAVVGATRLATGAERRPALVAAAVVVASVAGALFLTEAFSAVDVLFVDEGNGGTCGL